MPKKRDTLSVKKIREYEKQFLLDMAKDFIWFFNQEDLFDYFYHTHKKDFEKFNEDSKAQEKLRGSFRHVIETMKGMIIAYEDFSKLRTKANLELVKQASGQLNSLKSLLMKFDLGVRNDGFIDASAASAIMLEDGAKEEYGGKNAAHRIATWIENFKQDLARYKENFPIGVCRYDKCRIFFVKMRKDERYCSRQHANTVAVRRKREQERLKREKTMRLPVTRSLRKNG